LHGQNEHFSDFNNLAATLMADKNALQNAFRSLVQKRRYNALPRMIQVPIEYPTDGVFFKEELKEKLKVLTVYILCFVVCTNIFTCTRHFLQNSPVGAWKRTFVHGSSLCLVYRDESSKNSAYPTIKQLCNELYQVTPSQYCVMFPGFEDKKAEFARGKKRKVSALQNCC
jgi:hypothetical protein